MAMNVIFHLPNEMPTKFHPKIPIVFGTYNQIFYSVKSYRTDESIRHYLPDVRECYFEGERNLKFFKTYSKAHCEVECMANLTLEACNCSIFWMPRSNSTKICGLSEFTCSTRFASRLNEKEKEKCGCYPPCNNIKYEIDIIPGSIHPLLILLNPRR